MDPLALFKVLFDGFRAARSPEARKPMSPWLFWGMIAATLTFFGVFGYAYVTGRVS